MKALEYPYWLCLWLFCVLLGSCSNSIEEKTANTDSVSILSSEVISLTIPEDFRKEWTYLDMEEEQYHELCNPTTIQFRQDSGSGNWLLLQTDLLNAEKPKTISFVKMEKDHLTFCVPLVEGRADSLFYVLEKNPSVSGLATLHVYTTNPTYGKNETEAILCYARGDYKGALLPPLQECDFGDQPQVMIDSFYIVEATFCHLPTGEEDMKFQFKVICQKDGSLAGSANYDVDAGVATFSRGTWEIAEQGLILNIITAGQSSGDSLVEYPRTVSMASFYEVQSYKQCK